MKYDIFNGDADGIIAVLQMQLANPVDTVKITGVKRDIQLMKKVTPEEGDLLRVFDISMDKNMPYLHDALSVGARVFYADHHKAGVIPKHVNLYPHIDTAPDVCTSLIISDLLDKKYHLWAITAAYGDNLIERANREANSLGLSEYQKAQLQELGTYINYNGYGSDIAELHFTPEHLLHELLDYESPFEVIEQQGSIFHTLKEAYKRDMALAAKAEVLYESRFSKVIILEDAPWARRVSGVLGNMMANQSPNRAHAVVSHNQQGSFTVSVRAPLNNKQGAVDICSKFSTGGGRAAAGGINELEKCDINSFINELDSFYESCSPRSS
ncbi:DHH family phosphoesterase [Pseudoalteromonas sp. SMS1]|uniref:DHH family phosphoesterase n=1 Tax=Pseudoalteromonas sp. SMS1 TaxID=2908894 RepID=UPI001F366041|nr:DHH family phosphoesterase [Pseudoalteromonas sp. SMS1]MCF2857392.1 DHH family phosphoesterase [Pseudoalteromonas sp. SMS1]